MKITIKSLLFLTALCWASPAAATESSPVKTSTMSATRVFISSHVNVEARMPGKPGYFFDTISSTLTLSYANGSTTTIARFNPTGAIIALHGSATNDNANQFDVGESSEATNTTAVNAGTSDTFDDLLTITLTAGDWDVDGMIQWDRNSATWTEARAGFSTTAGDNQTGMSIGVQQLRDTWASSGSTPNLVSIAIPPRRLSLSATTTVYLKRLAVYSVGAPRTAGGRISARRVR